MSAARRGVSTRTRRGTGGFALILPTPKWDANIVSPRGKPMASSMPFVGSRERVKHIPDHFDAHYLFRTEAGVLARGQIQLALRKLATHLTYEGQPYLITAHQFRHSVATDMIE